MHDIDQLGAIRTLLDGSERYLGTRSCDGERLASRALRNRFKIRTESLPRHSQCSVIRLSSRYRDRRPISSRPRVHPCSFIQVRHFRGLEVLLGAISLIRAPRAGMHGRKYIPAWPFFMQESDDRYEALYDRCRQTRWSRVLRLCIPSRPFRGLCENADVLSLIRAFFRETSCISPHGSHGQAAAWCCQLILVRFQRRRGLRYIYAPRSQGELGRRVLGMNMRGLRRA